MIYLVSFHPLLETRPGRDAIEKYGLPPFIDATCRREPDFQHPEYPAISSLCRAGKFAPRLEVGDQVVYITAKGEYPGFLTSHWRLIAILEVVEKFDDHEAAADWYQEKGLELPKNCVVPGNDAQPLDQTVGTCVVDGKKRKARNVDEWDATFRARAEQFPQFFACKPLFRELYRPPILTERDVQQAFGGKMPDTLTPPQISEEAFESLKKACRIKY